MIADSLDPNNPISGEQDGIPRQQFAYDPPSIERLRKMFDDARSMTERTRNLGIVRRGYYDGPGQLKSEVRRILKARGQPPIYTNRVRPAINGLLGVLEQGQTDPRAYPRNPQDQDSADVATKGLRYVADLTRFQRAKLDVAENFFIEGTGAAIFEWDGENPTVTQIRWEEFFYDPYSRRLDFKDARYMGIAKWMDLDQLRRIYGEALRPLGDPMTGNSSALDATWQDRPDNTSPWVDRNRNRLMVVEMYHNEGGQWFRCVYIAAGVLEYDLSSYRNVRTGETRCPIEAQSCYIDADNGRYSPIDDMIPIQDEVNARRSRLLHLANSRQIQQADPQAAPVDANLARQEAAKADGVIPAGWVLVPTADIASGQQLLLAESKSEIERMGPTPAVLGQQGAASQSGRSRLVLQQAGMTELARPIGGVNDWENRCYRQMWQVMQQYVTGPWWIRVTDDRRAPEFLQINEPVPVMNPDGTPMMQIVAGPDGQPMLQPAVEVKHRIAEMDMDIIIDSVPDTANLAQEVWADLLELVGQGVPIGSPQFMIALEMSPLPNKTEIIERVEAWMSKQQENQQPDPLAEAAAQLELSEKQAAIENKNADTEKKQADTAQTYFEMGRSSVAQEPEAPINTNSQP